MLTSLSISILRRGRKKGRWAQNWDKWLGWKCCRKTYITSLWWKGFKEKTTNRGLSFQFRCLNVQIRNILLYHVAQMDHNNLRWVYRVVEQDQWLNDYLAKRFLVFKIHFLAHTLGRSDMMFWMSSGCCFKIELNKCCTLQVWRTLIVNSKKICLFLFHITVNQL